MWGEDVCADSVLGSCVTGKYSIEVDCVACVAGKYSPAGSTTCTDCPAGKTAPAGSDSVVDCVACAAGKFSASFTAAGPLKDMTNVWIWQASTPLRAQRAWTAPQVFTV